MQETSTPSGPYASSTAPGFMDARQRLLAVDQQWARERRGLHWEWGAVGALSLVLMGALVYLYLRVAAW